MAALKETLELAKRREQLEAWEKGEAAIATHLLMAEKFPAPPDIDEETRQALQPFVQWTTKTNARYCPAKPLTVAAYVLEQSATGASTEKLLQQLDAIGRMHDRHNLPNPCATHAARQALESVTNIEPPRSWKAEEKELFLTLPADIKAVVSRREQQREKELRRLQNELAAMKRQSTAADIKEPTKLKEETNG
jgi:hypothetical protein